MNPSISKICMICISLKNRENGSIRQQMQFFGYKNSI